MHIYLCDKTSTKQVSQNNITHPEHSENLDVKNMTFTQIYMTHEDGTISTLPYCMNQHPFLYPIPKF